MATQKLPTKEANLFRLVVKCYESKQYKKGIKAADQILKKFAEHGETLSMKGLILSNLSKKTEAYELVRKGLKNDLKSHVCWHVYGLLYRADGVYREAIKCYQNALRIEPENIQILRDISNLQIQMRDGEGFVTTRQKLLTLKSDQRSNWIAFSLAHHVNNNLDMALKVLEAYEGTLEDDYPPLSEKYEHGELLMYKVMILEEAGKFQEALKELEKSSSMIVDRLGWREQRATLLQKLGRPAEAEKVYWELLSINPDNYEYYRGLQSCLALKPDSQGTYQASLIQPMVKLYERLALKFPKSSAVKRIPLDFLEGAAFEQALDLYVRPFLRKGVPSLFSDLRPLYSKSNKADIIEAVLTRLEASLESGSSFPPTELEPEPPAEPPSTPLWLLFFAAQHYDERGQFEKALEKIDAAILHTPTVPDLYVVKASILDHCGDFQSASAMADEARQMDLADRFLNSEAVKRMLQADQVDEAERTAALFTKDEKQHETLIDMQCMWYELASGDSHVRQHNYGKALKKFLCVNKHYLDMIEDQFDFHTYCLRKMTLRAYVKMLRFEDTLHTNAFFQAGAEKTISCYLALHEQKTSGAVASEEDLAAMSAADRKKLRVKQKKAEAKAKKEAESRAASAAQADGKAGSGGGKAKAGRAEDPDPDGRLLAQVEDPLEEGMKHVRLLEEHCASAIHTHLSAFRVYCLRQKWLLALKSLKSQLKLAPSHPQVHVNSVQYVHRVLSWPELQPNGDASGEQEGMVREVVTSELTSMGLLDKEKLLEQSEGLLASNLASLPHRMAAAESLLLLQADKQRAVGIVEEYIERAEHEKEPALRLAECVEAHQFLRGALSAQEAAARWFAKCQELFPRSNYFQGAKSGAFVPRNKESDSETVFEFAANGSVKST